jgi:enoyl-CoA hydratase/carnithine racemase
MSAVIAESPEPVLLIEVCDHVATLTLNRPGKANTLSEDLIRALEDAIAAACSDDSVRVIVLAANGKIFCAGHDLAQMNAHADRVYFDELFARCSRMMLSIRNANKPVIAKVQGAAVAAGCQLVASCDLAYAAAHAKFGVNGINLGLFCSTPSVALSRTVLPKQAMELLLTGQLIDAARAAEIGLINRAVPAAGLDAVVGDIAKSIAGKLPAAIALGKDVFHQQLMLDEAQAYALAGGRMAENIGYDETRAMIDDFLSGAKHT